MSEQSQINSRQSKIIEGYLMSEQSRITQDGTVLLVSLATSMHGYVTSYLTDR